MQKIKDIDKLKNLLVEFGISYGDAEYNEFSEIEIEYGEYSTRFCFDLEGSFIGFLILNKE